MKHLPMEVASLAIDQMATCLDSLDLRAEAQEFASKHHRDLQTKEAKGLTTFQGTVRQAADAFNRLVQRRVTPGAYNKE